MDFTSVWGILGIIFGAIWIGVGLRVGEAFYDAILQDWWIKQMVRFRSWIDHFKKAPSKVGARLKDAIRDDINKLP